jgi:pimeloyl-ACP methyl ester carboxylesterase
MALLRDRTGRPGPATWEIGAYPQGHAELPVTGVSWYEAAAFAEFSGKSLPTVTHWLRATGMANLRDDIPLGNFASTAPLAVSSVRDLGAFGTFGMSGNVKEWCLNSVEGQRYLLGGAWNEPIYMATVLDARPAFDRSDTNGIRLAKFDAPPADSLVGEIRALPRHITFPPPVSDAVFEAYRSFYAYDKTDLDPRLERTEESDHWRREIVSVATAYGRDRLPINLLLPKNASPPYQAVIYYPGAYAYSLPSSEDLPVSIYFDFIVRSGRAVIHPIYQNTYERRLPESRMQGRTRRDVIIDSAKDLGRTIDYLQTRADVDANKLGFHVLSTGPQILPAIAMEPRLKTAILLSAGFGQARARTAPPAEVDPVNFAPRITIPVLLLGGRYDFVLPLETSQKPLFALLGTPPADKHHSIFDAGHIPPRNLMIKETLDWLDKYLGPVKAR